MKSVSIGIVVSDFNDEITSKMLKSATSAANSQGGKIAKIIHVPGAYEIPFAVELLIQDHKIDSIATLGAIIKGETKHDEIISLSVCKELLSISLKYKKPIGLGIIGPGADYEHALARSDEYAQRSIKSAIKMTKIFSE